jgi:sulfopyruvate decarboxylase subunit beta
MADLDRADVLRLIDAAAPDSPMVLGLGGIAREMLAVAGRKGNHFISLDAMGQTVSVALGIALGLERRAAPGKVIAIEGDGSLLMGLSVLSTVGHLKPGNLVVYVLDNGVYLATGGQPTASADIDLVTVATACSWRGAREVRTADELAAATAWALTISSRTRPSWPRISAAGCARSHRRRSRSRWPCTTSSRRRRP